MAKIMISLAAAQQAIKSVIDYYSRDIAAIRERAAQRAPDEEPEEGEEALLIAARLAREGAERARRELAAVPVFEAVDFACARIIDKRGIPERMHDFAKETAVHTVLHNIEEYVLQAGMVDVRWSEDSVPEQSRVTVRFTMMRPMDARWTPPTREEATECKR